MKRVEVFNPWPAEHFDGAKSLKALMWIVLSSLVSFLVVACLFPDLLIHRRNHLMYTHDLSMPLEDTFILISQFFHGGIALWDRFDQMNYAYAHLTGGFFTVVNFLVAGIYIVLSKFFSCPGELFHSVYVLSFHAITIFIRTAGGYLLLQRFCQRKSIIVFSLVIFNTLLSSFMYTGLFENNLYSYLPLIVYLVMRIVDYRRWKDVLAFVILMTIAVANSPLFALAYFYEVVHFFIISALVLSLIVWGRRVRSIKCVAIPRMRMSLYGIGQTIIAVILCLLIMAPSLILFQSLKEDFLVADSGLGKTHGRLNNIFSPSGYFNAKGRTDLDLQYFIPASLNYLDNVWGSFYLFIGGSVFFLSLIGLVLVRNQWKWVVLATIILVLLVNEQNPPASIWALPHWINVFTNPFAFLLRSFHMSYILMTYLYLPLVALGLVALRASCLDEDQSIVRSRIPVALVGCVLLTVVFAYSLPFQLRGYGVGMGLSFTLMLYLGWGHNRLTVNGWGRWLISHRKYFVLLMLMIIFAVEYRVLSIYATSNEFIYARIQPRVFPMLGDQTPMILDFQNPKVLPLREHFRFNPATPLIHTHQNHYGFFYGFMPMERFMREPSIYEPRPLLYKDWPVREDIKDYLKTNQQWLVNVPYAISSQSMNLSSLVKQGLQDRLVVLDAALSEDQSIFDQLPENFSKEKMRLEKKDMTFAFFWDQAQLRKTTKGYEYSWALPQQFPAGLTTTVFGEDRHRINFSFGKTQLVPAQGKLIVPGTFDVGNVHHQRLSVLLPAGMDIRALRPTLTVTSSEVKSVERNEHDRLGLTYAVAQDGWLIIHYPFDRKWVVHIDGKIVPVIRANEFFMAVPVKKGERKILLEYWPQTPLRPLILVSVVLSMVLGGWLTVSYLGERKA